MKYTVKNTINGEIETFNTMEDVNNHIKSEIAWFNSPGENDRGDGYNEDDFIVDEK
jgi:hypothetical protein